jgi:MFS family permease
LAEIGITGIALVGFISGDTSMPNVGVWIVLSTVFLMGTHSTFFVPAKYGAMPEILTDEMLSKGNGVLESLSFLAVIFGTVCGGVLSYYFHDREFVIGLIMVSLAVIGALASLLIRRMPAANPERPLPKYVYQPLWVNLKSLIQSKPLVLALVGIAFFTFMLAYMRQAVYMLGESRIPRWNEFQTSLIVGTTALGIGIGAPLAGYLSGKKVELGLIPIGGLGMIVAILLAGLFLNHVVTLVACIILIGAFTGFYLVPMFAQLQHRAPTDQKGEVVATSNFTNVIGAILASFLFFTLVRVAHTFEVAPKIIQEDVYTNRELIALQLDKHHRPVYFRIEKEPGLGKDVGEAQIPLLDVIWPEDPDPVAAHPEILVSQKAIIKWHGREEIRLAGKEPGLVMVTVSKWEIETRSGKKHHYYFLRLADEPQRTMFDNRELPRYLFFGAGLMTLGVLFFLGYLLPDLVKRSRWLVWSLGKDRMTVAGIMYLPGHGGVLLATDAALPETRTAVCWASDRIVSFLGLTATEKDLQDAEHRLKFGGVVALSMDVAGGPGDREYERLSRVSGLTIIPVHAKPSEVKFGPALKARPSADQVREAIAAVKMSREE